MKPKNASKVCHIENYLYICSNSTRHASRRTAYQGGSFAFIEYEVHEITNGSAKSGSSSEGQRIAY